MIIHIEGLPGSGKTTLGKELSKCFNIDVIDLDDIYCSNKLKFLSKYNFDTGQQEQILKLYRNELIKTLQEDVNEIIEKYKDKNLFITGRGKNLFITGRGYIENKFNVDKGFYIKIDNDLRYKQFNMRTLDSINDHYDDIKEILNSDISTYKKEIIICAKYRINGQFMCPFMGWKDDVIYTVKEELNTLGYKYATYTEIINEIEKLLITDNSYNK